MNSYESVSSILNHNWLSVYDCCDPKEYESINEKEEMLKGNEQDEYIK